MHSDIYATDDKSWNIIFPLITVEGTDPELDIMAEDMNTIIGVHYLRDVAYAIGDFGKTFIALFSSHTTFAKTQFQNPICFA